MYPTITGILVLSTTLLLLGKVHLSEQFKPVQISKVLNPRQNDYRDVVEHLVYLFDHSRYYPEDYNFFLRTAYFETGFHGYRNKTGGIWQISLPNFNRINAVLDSEVRENVTGFLENVSEYLRKDIITDWAEVTYDDMDMPLYSAVATSILHLKSPDFQAGMLSFIDLQAQIWFQIKNGGSSAEDIHKFKDVTKKMESRAFPCRNPMDLFILMDGSSDDQDQDLVSRAQKTVVREIVKNLDLSITRLGIVGYGDGTSIITDLKAELGSPEELDDLIENAYIARNGPATNRALETVLELVEAAPSRTSAAKTLLIFSLRKSIDGISSIQRLIEEHNVEPLVVTVGDFKSFTEDYKEELRTLADGQEPLSVFHEDFLNDGFFHYRLLADISKAHVPLELDVPFVGHYSKQEKVYCKVNFPNGNDVVWTTVRHHTASPWAFYHSENHPYPGEAKYSMIWTSEEPGGISMSTTPSNGSVAFYLRVSGNDFEKDHTGSYSLLASLRNPGDPPTVATADPEEQSSESTTTTEDSQKTSTDGGAIAGEPVPHVLLCALILAAIKLFCN